MTTAKSDYAVTLEGGTNKSRLLGNRLPQTTSQCGLRRKLRLSSSAVATSREGHRQQRSGRAGQHRRWGLGRSAN